MKTIATICNQLTEGAFEFTRHAFQRAVERNISDAEIRQAAASATLIEDYPGDKYTPSCLLLGFTRAGRALHLQVSRSNSEPVKIITLYEPDETEWSNNLTKRR